MNCDLIFITTDNISLINRISALRPKAYICVFSDLPTMKNLTALNFGVYCFNRQYENKSEEFISTFGQLFGIGKKAHILHLETNSKGHVKKLFYDII